MTSNLAGTARSPPSLLLSGNSDRCLRPKCILSEPEIPPGSEMTPLSTTSHQQLLDLTSQLNHSRSEAASLRTERDQLANNAASQEIALASALERIEQLTAEVDNVKDLRSDPMQHPSTPDQEFAGEPELELKLKLTASATALDQCRSARDADRAQYSLEIASLRSEIASEKRLSDLATSESCLISSTRCELERERPLPLLRPACPMFRMARNDLAVG